MNSLEIVVTTPEKTISFAKKLATFLSVGDVILLDGQLGAGKTTFTKGLALGLGITRNIKSPTFTLVREYQQGRLPLYHMDVYRLEESEGDDLGFEEYLNGNGVCVIEWSQFIADQLPKEKLVITFIKDQTDVNKRKLILTAYGKHYETLLEQLNA